jgi:phosphohistidine phosphatase
VFYFAHNPAITDFVNKMTAANIANVPTTGVVSIAFDVKYWREIDTNGKLVQFEYPKRLKK